jgi:hypothetical protein
MLAPGRALSHQGQCHISGDGAPREKGAAIVLEYDGDMVCPAIESSAVKLDATRSWRQQPGEQAQQGCLAAARRPHDGNELTTVDFEVESPTDCYTRDIEIDTAKADRRHCGLHSRWRLDWH